LIAVVVDSAHLDGITSYLRSALGDPRELVVTPRLKRFNRKARRNEPLLRVRKRDGVGGARKRDGSTKRGRKRRLESITGSKPVELGGKRGCLSEGGNKQQS
jgi:hypothetical protein